MLEGSKRGIVKTYRTRQRSLPNLAVLDQGAGASRRRAARSGTPYGRAAWAPVPPAVPIGRPCSRQFARALEPQDSASGGGTPARGSA